jgi:hypothetical protein
MTRVLYSFECLSDCKRLIIMDATRFVHQLKIKTVSMTNKLFLPAQFCLVQSPTQDCSIIDQRPSLEVGIVISPRSAKPVGSSGRETHRFSESPRLSVLYLEIVGPASGVTAVTTLPFWVCVADIPDTPHF